MSDTPISSGINDCIRRAIRETDHERQIALREAAECGIADLERENAELKRQLAEARDKTLEDAAAVVGPTMWERGPFAHVVESAIRQLKGQS